MKIVLAQMDDEVYETFEKAVERIEGADILYVGPEQSRAEPPADSFYYCWFDEKSPNWMRDPHNEYNQLFLRNQQNWANDMLRARGHLFLNEILASLGLPHTKVGSLVGWMLEDDSPHISFGDREEGPDGSIRLDFNVQGVIANKLPM